MAKQSEQVQEIPIAELFPFKDHPFRVLDDEAMQRTVESISQFGVLAPAIARPRPEGGYEIIAGHRRLHASQLLGLETMPVLVRQMDDDTAIIAMVDSNLQRETMLPSERARAYKMKMDAIWGAINLLEGYGNDNPGAKSQGMKQLMAGGGVALIGTTLVPLLSGLFG